MKKYDFLLFDADGTLFDFNQNEYEALRGAFADKNMNIGGDYERIYHAYHDINDALWKALERAEVTKEQLVRLRFERLFEQFDLGSVPDDFNECYLYHLAQGRALIEGAEEVCRALKERGKYMAIITNGMASVQSNRFENSGIIKYFDGLYISEVVGCPKPQRAFFDKVYAEIPAFDLSRALIIGDSLTSDIKGGNNASTDTCWFNPQGAENASSALPTYEIKNLYEVLDIIGD